jgi:hypothetical protein
VRFLQKQPVPLFFAATWSVFESNVAASHKRLGQFKDGPDVDLAASGDVVPSDFDKAIWAD